MAAPMEGSALIYPTFGGLVPDENPLSDSGRWGSYSTRPPLKVLDSGGAIHGTVEFAVNGSYYRQQSFQGPVIEAYGCRPDSGLGAALESNRIVALIGDPDAYNGYSSGYGGGIGEAYFFRRYDAFSFTGIGDNGAADGGVGVGGPGPEKLGIRILPDRVQQWGFNSGYSADWFLVQTAFDVTHRGPTFFALETEEQGGLEEVSWTCFAAGVLNRTQIYRVVRGLS